MVKGGTAEKGSKKAKEAFRASEPSRLRGGYRGERTGLGRVLKGVGRVLEGSWKMSETGRSRSPSRADRLPKPLGRTPRIGFRELLARRAFLVATGPLSTSQL